MRRKADAHILADALDAALPPRRRVMVKRIPPQADPLVETAAQLARGPHPALDWARADRIEADVLAAADRVDFASARPRRPMRSRFPAMMRWAVAACLALTLAVGVMLAVAMPERAQPDSAPVAAITGSDTVTFIPGDVLQSSHDAPSPPGDSSPVVIITAY